MQRRSERETHSIDVKYAHSTSRVDGRSCCVLRGCCMLVAQRTPTTCFGADLEGHAQICPERLTSACPLLPSMASPRIAFLRIGHPVQLHTLGDPISAWQLLHRQHAVTRQGGAASDLHRTVAPSGADAHHAHTQAGPQHGRNRIKVTADRYRGSALPPLCSRSSTAV